MIRKEKTVMSTHARNHGEAIRKQLFVDACADLKDIVDEHGRVVVTSSYDELVESEQPGIVTIICTVDVSFLEEGAVLIETDEISEDNVPVVKQSITRWGRFKQMLKGV